MTTDLKPCPFCGGAAEYDSQQAYAHLAHPHKIGTRAVIYCTECDCQMGVCDEDFRGEADLVGPWLSEKWNIRAAMAAQSWRPISENPPVGSKIIALYADGSGSTMLFRHDGGFIDQDGDDWECGELSDQYAFWTLLPPNFEFWCETLADDPMQLSVSVRP